MPFLRTLLIVVFAVSSLTSCRKKAELLIQIQQGEMSLLEGQDTIKKLEQEFNALGQGGQYNNPRKSQIDGLRSQIEAYKSETDQLRAQLEGERERIEELRTRLSSYTAKFN